MPFINLLAWVVDLPFEDYHSHMMDIDEDSEAQGSILCRSCGLCCTGHLFAWVKLKSSELDAAEGLGMDVCRSDPAWRGFSQPCPLWQGECTIYHTSRYPRACRAYQCKLLKEVLHGSKALSDAQAVVNQAKGMIHEVEAMLPASPNPNFRARLVAHIENPEPSAAREESYRAFLLKADALLRFYDENFGVNDLVESSDFLSKSLRASG
ncbi:MAG: hypothetical protein GX491_05760 [Chloroflexi bacterium]|nr:hypothetical protein [Chloroflexota bacterium]